MSTTNQSSVVLENVDDYLAPSQACVNPLFQPTEQVVATTTEKTIEEKKDEVLVLPRRRKVVRRPVIEQPLSAAENQVESILADHNGKKEAKKTEAVKASIADCLACSGCVTTAETVLLEQHHSLTSLQQRLSAQDHQQGRFRVLTLSPNSLADLCRHWKLSNSHHYYLPRFVTLLHQILKVNVVVDGNVPLEWTWQEEAHEFVQHYRRQRNQAATRTTPTTASSIQPLSPPPPSTAIDSTRTMYYLPDGTTPIVTYDPIVSSSSSSPPLDPYAVPTQIPLLSGSCPALVCLIEKSLPTLVPHLSQTLSPMTRMGWALWQALGNAGHEHWAIMPCHDKKLEASRKDFLLIGQQQQQQQGQQQQAAVDMVLTTMELVELMEEYWRGVSTTTTTTSSSSMVEYLESLPAARTWSPDNKNRSIQDLQEQIKQHAVVFWTNNPGTPSSLAESESEWNRIAFSAGGHADYIFRYAAKELFGHSMGHVKWTPTASSSSSSSMNHHSTTHGATTIKSVRLANLQKKQQSYQATLYRNAADGSYTQERQQQQEQEQHQEAVLRFAMVRGMQTMQRALKDLDSTFASPNSWDYVEAMACPHGCVNGGGSVRTPSHHPSNHTILTKKETPTETKLRVDQTIQALILPHPFILVPTTNVGPHFQTRYHVVPPMHHALGAAAGVKVQDMQW